VFTPPEIPQKQLRDLLGGSPYLVFAIDFSFDVSGRGVYVIENQKTSITEKTLYGLWLVFFRLFNLPNRILDPIGQECPIQAVG